MVASDWDGTSITVSRLHPYHAGDFQTGEDWCWERGISMVASDTQRSELLRLWDALPRGIEARCHYPVYGFSAARGESEVFRRAWIGG